MPSLHHSCRYRIGQVVSAWQNSTDNGTVFALTADATLNLIVWGFIVLAIIVIILEYARHRGHK